MNPLRVVCSYHRPQRVSSHRLPSIDSVKIIEVRAGDRILDMWTELAALRAMDKNRKSLHLRAGDAATVALPDSKVT